MDEENKCEGCKSNLPKIGIYHARNGKITGVCFAPKPIKVLEGRHYLTCKNKSCLGCLPEPV